MTTDRLPAWRWWAAETPLGALRRLRRARKTWLVLVADDVFSPMVGDECADMIFACMASLPRHQFEITTAHPERMRAWFERVRAGGALALDAYAAYLRDDFEQHCAGYDRLWAERVTRPPTPELRFIYDSAAMREIGDRAMARLRGFSGGEYHWRDWPLGNVVIVEERPS